MNIFSRYILTLSVILLSTLTLVVSCKKEDEELRLDRRFSPATISSKNGETAVVLTWAKSLFTTTGDVEYVVEVSKDQTFATAEYTVTTSDVTTTVTDDKIGIKQDYYARVKAVGKNGMQDSNWLTSTSFRITGEQFLNPITSTQLTDVGVQVKWRLNPDLTKIVITPTSGSAVSYTLTAGEKASGVKEIMGLSPLTNYSAEIFLDTKSKGVVTFKTKASISGNIIDLSTTSGNPGILASTLPTAASGSVIVLRRGENYDITAGYSFDKSISIVTALGFGTNYATIRMTTNFNVVANSVIDSLVFKDVVIKGYRAAFASYNNDYILNINTVCTVAKIRLENCNVKILRGVVRLQTASTGAKVTNYFINNCLMDSIREYGIATASSSSYFTNISMTNSTAYRFRRFIDHRVAGNTSIRLANNTLNEVVAGAAATTNAVIDFSPATPGNTTITNCIFGKTWDETNAGTVMAGFRAPSGTPLVTGSFSTSDFVNTANPIPSLVSYSGAASTLFVDPNNGNFTIKDATFVGRNTTGDPRWRIN